MGSTNIRYSDGKDDVHAPLAQLVAAAGLGGAQRAATSAQTRTGMAASLTRQADALRDLVPVLHGTSGYGIIMKPRPETGRAGMMSAPSLDATIE